MSYYVAASAIGTLMDYGYTEAEAKRIRGFMPRRFQMFGQVLPLTNIEAWLAYLAVKHYCQNTEERGRFGLDYPSGYLNMQPHEKMHYVTKDQKVEFSTREFVRHFGDVLRLGVVHVVVAGGEIQQNVRHHAHEHPGGIGAAFGILLRHAPEEYGRQEHVLPAYLFRHAPEKPGRPGLIL